MVDKGLILVTGAAGQVGSVGRTLTGLLLDRGFPVRAMVRREDERAASLRAAGAQWRAVNSPLVHTVFYLGIIAWESVTMLLCWWAGVRLLKSYRADRAQFAAALDVAVIALTTSLLMWLVAFLDVGGEWFLMWQSKMWNGQEEAFRMFTIVGVVFLVVVQREPTPD